MIKLDPQDRILHSDERRFPIILIVLLFLTAIGAGSAYWYYATRPPAEPAYKDVYAQLGISPLPARIELRPHIRDRLDELRREPCYRDAMFRLSDALVEAGYPRESAVGILSFAKRCTGSDDLLA